MAWTVSLPRARQCTNPDSTRRNRGCRGNPPAAANRAGRGPVLPGLGRGPGRGPGDRAGPDEDRALGAGREKILRADWTRPWMFRGRVPGGWHAQFLRAADESAAAVAATLPALVRPRFAGARLPPGFPGLRPSAPQLPEACRGF